MTVLLTQALVMRLGISECPAPKPGGKAIFEANAGLRPYIVFDERRHAPPGFGVRVHPSGKKTYTVQRPSSLERVGFHETSRKGSLLIYK